MKTKHDDPESLGKNPKIQTVEPEPTEEENRISYIKKINTRLDELIPELSKFIQDDKLTQFRQELIQWLDEGKHLPQDDFEDVADFTNKLYRFIKTLARTSKIDNYGLAKLKSDFDKLKLKLPPTTLGRVLLGILTAFMLPIFALIETILLPISLPLYYATKRDFPYKMTREIGSFSSRMFRSPLYPAFKIVEEIYAKFDETVKKSGLSFHTQNHQNHQ